ncbi:bifunctional riboflavin kinase/FAD synthetase [Solimonas marina]|uniref:Riboflavin biosynthesis protein n=1 Tax=Solimonas marina TaxID=2714601 RepID=A0A969W9L2_9GAMM|nr:bifunctional riboflavin kinase/FAD synthetase [Solimonas marina]NKF23177.1 bifunctional riboflavin kinase/FAD synthetase [Solimonas marina]
MRVVRGLHNLPRDWRGCALTIGNFDGVHRGHQALIARAREHARRLGLPLTVMCFEPTPREYFAPQTAPLRVSNLRTKLADFADAGVDAVVIQRFAPPFCALDGHAFIAEALHERLQARAIVVGDDFSFGARRSGDMALLRAEAPRYGYVVEAVDSVLADGLRCSSTALREALALPDFAQAAQILGRSYRIVGRVQRGLQLGRTLDMPTANVNFRRQPVLRLGIYAVVARIDGSDREWPGVAALGVRPTLGLTRCLLETHFFDPPGDLYGKTVSVEFRRYQRAEERFETLEALQAQMHRDKADAMAFLGVAPDN